MTRQGLSYVPRAILNSRGKQKSELLLIYLIYTLYRPQTLINLYYNMSNSEGDDSDDSCERFSVVYDERIMKASSTDGDAKSDEDESAASAPSIEPSMTLAAM